MTNEINIFEDKEEEEEELVIKATTSSPIGLKKAKQEAPSKANQLLAEHYKHAIEALLFSSNEALSIDKIRAVLGEFDDLKPKMIRQLICELQLDYTHSKRAFQLDEGADGFILRTRDDYYPYVRLLHADRRPERLSQAASEVLAIITYRQPTTRSIVDSIRGVDSSGSIYRLIDLELIEAVGKLEAPGRPTLYGVGKKFLQHFGLTSLDDLPDALSQTSLKN